MCRVDISLRNVVFVVVLSGAVALTGCGPSIDEAVVDRRAVAVGMLCAALVEDVPEGLVVIVDNPFRDSHPQARALNDRTVALIRAALPGRPVKVEAVPVRPRDAWPSIPGGTTAPLSYVMASDALMEVGRRHADAVALVSMVGFPEPTEETRHVPGYFLFPDIRLLDEAGGLDAALRAGWLAAAVLDEGAGELRLVRGLAGR
jgi:hypothetical protein